MRKQSLAIVVAGLLVAGRALAGSLDPTNAPGPTMHTLEEIYQKMNNLAVVTNAVTYSAAVPKTGQTNVVQTGDDGTYQKGVARPNPRFTIQANTNCVLDNLTGLIWARNANLGGSMIVGDAIIYCENLNYGGQSDWRLPNIEELRSLIDWRYYEPALCNTDGTGQWTGNVPFAGVQYYYYWSGTFYAGNSSDHAWSVDMQTGVVSYGHPLVNRYVWPVRGGQ